MNTGATELRNFVDQQYLEDVLVVYNDAIKRCFVVAVVVVVVVVSIIVIGGRVLRRIR